MLPKIVSPSELRKDLATFLDLASDQLIVVKTKPRNKVIMDEKEYNRLTALADQFMAEDPEGEYRPEFVGEILSRSKDKKINKKIKSLKDLM